MNILPVLERLRDQLPDYRVESPTVLLTAQREELPAVQVLPGSESPVSTEGLGTTLLVMLNAQVEVLIAAAAAVPETDSDPLAEAVAEVRAALIGYQHSEWDLPLTWVSGDLVAPDSARLLWREVYTTQRSLSATIVSS
ncbi:MAG: hypothetical protein MUF57_01125 [Gammaproteobacteria bacterium]|nr:hypothetical protein [Gammaproteobacteria bacterium]